MKKAWKLMFILIVFISLQGFSQTPDKSSHPLLDKYYPRPKVDTPETVIIQRPAPETPKKIVPQKSTTIPETKPIAQTKIIPAATPVVRTPDSTTVSTEPAVATPVTTTVSAPVAPVVSAPVQPVVAAPTKKPIVSKPETPYNRERLGSSSPLYNTWEKNKNGAGSVTTGSK